MATKTSLFSAVLFLEYNGGEVAFSRKEAVKFTTRARDYDFTVEKTSEWFKDLSEKKRG